MREYMRRSWARLVVRALISVSACCRERVRGQAPGTREGDRHVGVRSVIDKLDGGQYPSAYVQIYVI